MATKKTLRHSVPTHVVIKGERSTPRYIREHNPRAAVEPAARDAPPRRLSYLDTSAAMKLVVPEHETAAMVDLVQSGARRMVSSWLLHTELHCAAGRHPDDVDVEQALQVLRRVALVDLTRGDLIGAGTHAPLRSPDAIHLAVAIRVGADEMVTYDAELAAAAERAGLVVLAPA